MRSPAQKSDPFETNSQGILIAENSYPLDVNPTTGCYVWDGQCAAFKQHGGGELKKFAQSCSGQVAGCVAGKVAEATAIGIVISVPTRGAEALSDANAKNSKSTSSIFLKGASKALAPLNTSVTVIQLPVFYQYCTLISEACSGAGYDD